MNPLAAPRHADAVRRLVVNLLAMLASQALTFSLTFALRVVLARAVGDVGFGKLTFALSASFIYSMAMGLGLSPLVAKEVARRRDAGPAYLTNGLALRLAAGLLLYAGMMIVVASVKDDAETVGLTALVGFALFLSTLGGFVGALFEAHQQMVAVSVSTVVEKALTLVVAFGLLGAGLGTLAIGWAMVAATAASFAYLLWSVRRLVRLKLRVDLAVCRSLVIAGLPFYVVAVFTTIYARIDATMLSLMTNDAVTGWYGVAFSLYETLSFLPAILKTLLLPILSGHSSDARHGSSLRAWVGQGVRVYAVIAAPMALGTAILARPVLGLIYPLSTFGNAVVLLRILAIGFIPLFFNILLVTIVVALDRQRAWSMVAGAMVIANPALNLWLIPWSQRTYGNGGIGAALATNVVEVILLAFAVRLLPAGILVRRDAVVVARAFLAALPMSGLAWLLRDDPVIPVVALSAGLYIGCGFLTGALNADDVAFVRSAVLRKAARRGPPSADDLARIERETEGDNGVRGSGFRVQGSDPAEDRARNGG